MLEVRKRNTTLIHAHKVQKDENESVEAQLNIN